MSRSRYFLSFFWPVAGYLLVVLAVVVWFVRPWDTTTSDAATVKSRAGPASTAGTESKDSDTKQNKDNLFYACILAITGALGVAGRQAAQAAREMYDADRHACQIEDEKAHFMSVVETANAQIEELHRSQAAAFREFEKKVAERQAEFNKEIETVKKEHENILCREKSKDIGAEAVRVEQLLANVCIAAENIMQAMQLVAQKGVDENIANIIKHTGNMAKVMFAFGKTHVAALSSLAPDYEQATRHRTELREKVGEFGDLRIALPETTARLEKACDSLELYTKGQYFWNRGDTPIHRRDGCGAARNDGALAFTDLNDATKEGRSLCRRCFADR